MRTKLTSIALASMLVALVSCNKESSVKSDQVTPTPVSRIATKAYGDKTPKLVGYVETNDVNPLNALDYVLSDGSEAYDIVNLFAANLKASPVDGTPCVYFNDNLAPIMASPSTYITPLQNAGMKVLLTILPDWNDIGLCTMTASEAYDFADLLARLVDDYGLDGIDFDDEYEGNNYTQVANSYGNIIYYLRSMLDSDKLITVFDFKHTGPGQIYANAANCIDYAYSNFSFWNPYTNSNITGMTAGRWAPISINLGNTYSSYQLYLIKYYAGLAKTQGYGAIMTFNLRSKCDVDPLPVLNAIADGAWSETVSMSTTVPSGVTAGCRPKPTATTGVYYY